MIWSFLLLSSISMIAFYKLFPLILSILGGKVGLFALGSDAFVTSARISMVWAIVNSSLMLVAAATLAWVFKRKKRILMALLVIPWAVPMYLATLSFRFAVYGINGDSIASKLLLPSDVVSNPATAFFWSVLLSVWLDLPLATLSISTAIDDVPKDLLEAARIDGASESKVFACVVLPQISPVLEGWFLIQLVRFVHSFTVPFLLVDGGVPSVESVTSLGALGNVSTLGVLNNIVFSSPDETLQLSYSAATYVFLMILASVWMFSGKWRKYSVAFFAFFWFLVSGDILSLVVIPAPFLKVIPSLILSLFVLILSGGKTISAYIPLFLTLTSMIKIKGLGGWFVRPLGWGVAITAVLMGIFLVCAVFLTAFTDFPDVGEVNTVSFDSIQDVLRDGFIDSMINSIKITLPVVVFTPFLSLPLAYFMSRKASWLPPSLMVLRSISGVHVLTVLFLIYSRMNLLNTFIGVSLLVVANTIPQAAVFLKGHVDTIPKELEEIAILDGGRGVARRIVFRLLLPHAGVAALMGFTAGWNAFLAPLFFLMEDRLYPVSVKLYSYVGNLMYLYPKWNLFGAGAILSLTVSTTVFLMIRKISSMLKYD